MESRVSWDLQVVRVFKDPREPRAVRVTRATKGL